MSLRPFALLALALLAFDCSSPRPTASREDAVLTGEETAKKAGEAAREAQKNGQTGLIAASSSKPDAGASPTSPEKSVNSTSSVLRIHMKKGIPTMNGEPIPEQRIDDILKGAVQNDAGVIVIVVRDADTGPEATNQVLDAARNAGVKHVQEQQELE